MGVLETGCDSGGRTGVDQNGYWDAYKHLLQRYGTCRQMPLSYWLVVLGIIMLVPNGCMAEKLPILRCHTRRRSKGSVYVT
jgi:hypothetical protein